jgi:hypothetical protein
MGNNDEGLSLSLIYYIVVVGRPMEITREMPIGHTSSSIYINKCPIINGGKTYRGKWEGKEELFLEAGI